MFGTVKYGASAYAKVGVETGVTAASPHKLITMLFEGALVAISNAQQHMTSGNIPAKGKSISKAILIVESGLRGSLDKNAGGDIAQNLDALYEYISARLLEANLKNDLKLLEESYTLLMDLKNAWEAIDNSGQATQAAPASQQAANLHASAYDPLMPRTSSLARA